MTAPSVVAIGGGPGLSTVLEAMVDRASSLVGVVSVADDGGSSGRIRRDLDIVAPGDMRRCLAALTPEGLMRDALEHRFESGVLAGHPAGNVVLAAMQCDRPGKALTYASARLRGDVDVVVAAMRKDPSAYDAALPEARDDPRVQALRRGASPLAGGGS